MLPRSAHQVCHGMTRRGMTWSRTNPPPHILRRSTVSGAPPRRRIRSHSASARSQGRRGEGEQGKHGRSYYDDDRAVIDVHVSIQRLCFEWVPLSTGPLKCNRFHACLPLAYLNPNAHPNTYAEPNELNCQTQNLIIILTLQRRVGTARIAPEHA